MPASVRRAFRHGTYCSSIEFSDATKLTPAHHEEVAGLDPADQQQWLEAARRSGWSAKDLRQALREARSLAAPDREGLLAEIRLWTGYREEADRIWRETIRAGAEFLTLREVADAAGVSHTHVRRILGRTIDRRDG